MTPNKQAVEAALEITEHPMFMSMLYLGREDAFNALRTVNEAARTIANRGKTGRYVEEKIGDLTILHVPAAAMQPDYKHQPVEAALQQSIDNTKQISAQNEND